MKKIQRVLAISLVVAAMSSVSIAPGFAGILLSDETGARVASTSLTPDQGVDRGFRLLHLFRSPMLSRILLRIALVG